MSDDNNERDSDYLTVFVVGVLFFGFVFYMFHEGVFG